MFVISQASLVKKGLFWVGIKIGCSIFGETKSALNTMPLMVNPNPCLEQLALSVYKVSRVTRIGLG